MAYQIIADSSCDMNPDLSREIPITSIPFFLTVGEETMVDDGSLDIPELIGKMEDCAVCAKTACPAPATFVNAYEKAEDSFVIAISSQLSGTYSSAEIGREMVLEESQGKNIHVIDSRSASAGETLIAIQLKKLMDMGLSFREIQERIEEFIQNMQTLFVLENLDNLVKNGRLSKVAGFVSSKLHLCPIMKGDQGNIALEEKIIGNKKALRRLGEKICEINERLNHDTLVIAHCNCLEKAERLKAEILAKCQRFKDIHIVATGGLSTVYAYNGGVVVAF